MGFGIIRSVPSPKVVVFSLSISSSFELLFWLKKLVNLDNDFFGELLRVGIALVLNSLASTGGSDAVEVAEFETGGFIPERSVERGRATP